MTSCPYVVVDVFARAPLEGNALAVFHAPGTVEPPRMQQIAREMNLAETTFVTSIDANGYDVRIFTPATEMPFAGHPTLGTAWALRHLGVFAAARLTQRSPAGATIVEGDEDRMWLTREGSVGGDLDAADVIEVLGGSAADIGFDAAEVGGRAEMLRPSVADAGVEQLMLPMRSADAVASLRAAGDLGHYDGVYCFAPLGPGRLKARFFGAGFGVAEDPATGSAAAALGLYLGARAGELTFQIEQGAEIGRPSHISVEAERGRARVGGQVHLAAQGVLYA